MAEKIHGTHQRRSRHAGCARCFVGNGKRRIAYSRISLGRIIDFDRVLGLSLANPDEAARKLAQAELKEEVSIKDLSAEIQLLIEEREKARNNRSWDRADEMRSQLDDAGYTIEDGAQGPKIFKK